MSSGYTEDELVEQPAIKEFQQLGWDFINAYHEVLATPDSSGTLGRETRDEVVLSSILSDKLTEYNPDIPAEQIEIAVKELSRDRSSMQPIRANKEIYHLMRDGVDVEYRDKVGAMRQETLRVIDWKNPENNNFLLVSQL